MASRIAVMSEGRIVQVGEPRDLYENPATRFVADFIGNVNVLDGNVAVRPEKIRLSRHLPPEQAWQPLKQVQGRVRDIAYFGSYTVYHLQLPSGQTLKVSQSNTERHPDDALRQDDQAWAWWSPSAQVVLTQ